MMNFENSDPQLSSVPAVDRIERWNIYSRLQQLAIPCTCSTHQPLQVKIETAAAAVQFWSVIQQFTAPRQTVIDRLERCWQQGVTSQ